MKREDIVLAWAKIRKIDNTIPDEVLDFMKDSAIAALEGEELYTKKEVEFIVDFTQSGLDAEGEVRSKIFDLIDYYRKIGNPANDLMFQRKK